MPGGRKRSRKEYMASAGVISGNNALAIMALMQQMIPNMEDNRIIADMENWTCLGDLPAE